MSPAQDGSPRGQFAFVLASLLFVAAWIVLNSFHCTGWVSAAVLTGLVLSALMTYVLIAADVLIGKFLIFALAAGVAELAADAWLVAGTKTLFYESREPLLLDSPVYMPAAWAVVLLQVGYLGYRAALRWGLPRASLLCGTLGGLLIPVYEHCAKGACWWYYEDPSHMLGNTPYYIILGEFLLALALPALLLACSRREFYWSLPIGVMMGGWIWISYYTGFALVS
jgi:hypothetical protein